MYYTFQYTNGMIDCKQFSTPEEARRYAHLEGDHLLDYRRTNGDDVEAILALHRSNGMRDRRNQ